MPLLDAALAFALTMLALSSLAGLILNWLHSLAGYRKKQLAKMLETLFVEEVIPEAKRQLETLSADKTAELKKQLDEAEKELAAEADAHPDDDLTRQQLAWLKVLGGSGVLQAIEDQSLTSLAWDELKEKLRASRRAQEVTDLVEQDVDQLLDQVSEAWERIGDRFTESFRAHARFWSIAVSLVLAFGLNIDAFYLLNAYMTDETATEAAIAQQAAILGNARPFVGNSVAEGSAAEGSVADSDAAAAPDLGAIRQQATALRSDNLAIGWNLFPNCPPASEDERCVEYWQEVVGGFDIHRLGFAERQAVSPPQRLVAPVLGFLGGGNISVPPPDDIPHTATEGGRGGGDLAGRFQPGPTVASGTPWPFGALLYWLLGCVLTGVLAGQGSPFWYEVVSSLGRLRDDLRQRRKKKEAETTGQDDQESES